MIRLAKWCIAHRRWVIGGWVAVAVLTTVIATAVGRQYATDFSLPGTESQRVVDLLKKRVPGAERRRRHDRLPQRARARRRARRCARAIDAAARAGARRCRTSSAWSALTAPHGAVQVSQATGRPRSRRSTTTSAPTCCRTTTGKPVLDAVNAIHVPGPAGRRRRPGDRAGRGLQHRPRDDGRRDRGAGDPAAHLRLADRGRDAADHRRASA